MQRLLMVIDPQMDFISGSLPVPHADKAMNGLAKFLLDNDGRYFAKVVTLDFHPWKHCSFKENGGQWPRHCAAWSDGAGIWPELLEPLFGTKGPVQVECKGQSADKEEYSIFQNPQAADRVRQLANQADEIDICGIAGDICVLNTLKDGLKIIGLEKFNLLEAFCPSLDGGKALKEFWRGGECIR